MGADRTEADRRRPARPEVLQVYALPTRIEEAMGHAGQLPAHLSGWAALWGAPETPNHGRWAASAGPGR
jgi:hypothetical protein